MATDMQSSLNGLLHTANRSTSGAHDRHASASPGSASHRFESMLESARPRSTEPGQEPITARHKQAVHPRMSPHAAMNPPSDRSERPIATGQEEQSVTQTQQMPSEMRDDVDDGQDKDSIESRDKSNQTAGLSPDMLLAAAFSPQSLMEGQAKAETPSPIPDSASVVEATVEEVESGKAPGLTPSESSSAPATAHNSSTVAPSQMPGQTMVGEVGNTDAKATTGPTKSSDRPTAKSESLEAALPSEINNQDAPDETSATVTDGLTKEAGSEPDKAQSTVTVTASHMMAKAATAADAADHSELQSPFDSVMRVSEVSADQSTSSAEQFLSQDQQSPSESRAGSDRATSNPLPSDDNTLRPQFLDQATGISPSAPPSGDSRVGREATGQAAMAHVSESERINELRGAFPSAQTVTLDLDPLDMGPLRVRIMMSDQTVHAHIRTEHGELGQSLLQQGPSLEASLRTTGLEMGMLRVTVDQQQQGRGEHAWAFQQQGRPSLASGGPAASADEERALRAGQDLYNNGRVSFFA